MFFPEPGESPDDALAVCQSCPARRDCLDYAIANNERFGIWGGLTEQQRRRGRHLTVAPP